MRKAILAVLVLAGFCFAQDSLIVTATPRAQRIDTIKATIEAPSFRWDNPDTTYIKRNASIVVRLRWYNPGSFKMCDTTVIWRATEIGIDAYKYSPVLKLHFERK
jgi:hypothetical protein